MYKRMGWLFFILTALVTVFIFSQSMKPAVESKEESEFFTNIFLTFLNLNPEFLTHILRKTAHFTEFFVQGACLSCAVICFGKYYKKIIYVLFCGLLTGVLDEYLQLFIEGRGSMVSDVLIDFSGTCTAVIIFSVIYYFMKKKNAEL